MKNARGDETALKTTFCPCFGFCYCKDAVVRMNGRSHYQSILSLEPDGTTRKFKWATDTHLVIIVSNQFLIDRKKDKIADIVVDARAQMPAFQQ